MQITHLRKSNYVFQNKSNEKSCMFKFLQISLKSGFRQLDSHICSAFNLLLDWHLFKNFGLTVVAGKKKKGLHRPPESALRLPRGSQITH